MEPDMLTKEHIDAAVQKVLRGYKLHPAVIDHERAIYKAGAMAGMRSAAAIANSVGSHLAEENILATASRIEQEPIC